MLSSRYRNRRCRFGLRINLADALRTGSPCEEAHQAIAGIYNYELYLSLQQANGLPSATAIAWYFWLPLYWGIYLMGNSETQKQVITINTLYLSLSIDYLWIDVRSTENIPVATHTKFLFTKAALIVRSSCRKIEIIDHRVLAITNRDCMFMFSSNLTSSGKINRTTAV